MKKTVMLIIFLALASTGAATKILGPPTIEIHCTITGNYALILEDLNLPLTFDNGVRWSPELKSPRFDLLNKACEEDTTSLEPWITELKVPSGKIATAFKASDKKIDELEAENAYQLRMGWCNYNDWQVQDEWIMNKNYGERSYCSSPLIPNLLIKYPRYKKIPLIARSIQSSTFLALLALSLIILFVVFTAFKFPNKTFVLSRKSLIVFIVIGVLFIGWFGLLDGVIYVFLLYWLRTCFVYWSK